MSDAAKLYIPVAGRGEVGVDGSTRPLVPGRVYLIPPYRTVTRRCARRLDLHWLHFNAVSPTLSARLAGLDRVYAWEAQRWRSWAPVYERMDLVLSGSETHPWLRMQAMLLDLTADVLMRAEGPQNPESQALIERLSPAIRYMDEHFRDALTTAQVARRVHLSPLHFHRLLRKALGLTPHQYIHRHRMLLARTLLWRCDDPVKEIADRCGFESQYYFSRAVKQYFGLSPTRLRDARRAQDFEG